MTQAELDKQITQEFEGACAAFEKAQEAFGRNDAKAFNSARLRHMAHRSLLSWWIAQANAE